ncbi:MAG: DUF885 domain-containing protein [Acidobacteriota bacterium]|nr:DUF885 domain-containing protein [Acidobacteriota bacterium]MDH3522147.1 DUF885 domain-containing protein [Acidobacteriota bacterium]
MHSRTRYSVFLAAAMVVALPLTPLAAQEADDWVARSNANSALLMEVFARFAPEAAGQFGVEGLDEEVTQLPLDLNEQANAMIEGVLVELRSRLAAETHAAVRQDLEILIDAAEQQIEGTAITDKYELPYFNLPQTVFQGIRALLDDQVAAERRPAALVRLRRYAGLEEGYPPIAEQATAFVRAKLGHAELQGPFKDDLAKDRSNRARFIDGIQQLFDKYEIGGYEEAYAALRSQLDAYDAFLESELAPRVREDFRLPAELYAFNLKGVGIDMPVAELVSRAKVSFREIQNEMQAVAALVAAERGLPAGDYRDVIAELKKEQLVGEAILPHYQGRIKDLEKLIAEHDVVTLPDREMRIRLASEAESAQVPAPNMRPPRLFGNTGEMGEFVLPLRIPGEDGEEVGFDDFTFEAASWTLTAHEGRPGHELQFASIVEKGVSQARVAFAFNSVNVEGWALYQEAEMKPYLPLEGQLIALQHRLLRAARAFLDPGLQLGMMDRDEAYRILEKDVVMSHPMAMQEVERYTFWAPGQATAYFCGYTRLMELRTDAERLLGDAFDRKAYHDFILAQGLLPPELLRKAVMEDFIGPRVERDEPAMKG